eukprot:TRINITY_DN4054_c0_g2_i1.p1 TRINITY_DN4054_c0_g2~~TRINITY_DN4054_c0_g2_i1.p1  ORF type:complete len:124 (+),score=18.81 TRINITY_DN4054_c0_g2_i1:124-495(+)
MSACNHNNIMRCIHCIVSPAAQKAGTTAATHLALLLYIRQAVLAADSFQGLAITKAQRVTNKNVLLPSGIRGCQKETKKPAFWKRSNDLGSNNNNNNNNNNNKSSDKFYLDLGKLTRPPMSKR